MADAHGSGPCESNFMRVQVPPLAPNLIPQIDTMYLSAVSFFYPLKAAYSKDFRNRVVHLRPAGAHIQCSYGYGTGTITV